MTLTLTTDLDEVAAHVAAIQVDEERLLAELGEELVASTRQRLDVEKTGPDGQPWPGWAPGSRDAHRPGDEVMESSGALMASIRALATRGALEVGTPLFYGALHQRGGAGRPARPFLGIGAADEDAILEAALGTLQEAVAHAAA